MIFGRKVRAAIITIEDFQRRFIDRQAEETRDQWRNALHELSAPRVGSRSSLEILRELGYPDERISALSDAGAVVLDGAAR